MERELVREGHSIYLYGLSDGLVVEHNNLISTLW